MYTSELDPEPVRLRMMGTHTQDLISSVVMSVLIILALLSPVCIQRLVGILQRQRQTEDLYFTRRCIRTGFCSPDLDDFHNLYISSDEKLFNKILTCPNHILRTLLPLPTVQNYSLRNRPHNRQLPDHISQITDCNFTVRMLYRHARIQGGAHRARAPPFRWKEYF